MADSILSGSGIYAIRNKQSQKSYIGSAVNIDRRLKEHRQRLKAGAHHSPKLQRAWAKYGEDCFEFVLLERVEINDLIAREQFWMDHHGSALHGYNVCPVAGSILGVKRSAETRAKMSASQARRVFAPLSDEHKKSISLALKGRSKSPDTRAKLSAAHKGKTVSAETRAKLSAATLGMKHTEEAKSRIGAAAKGRVKSEAERANISAARVGRIFGPLTEEHKRNISKASKGRKQTPESVAKRVATRKRNALAKQAMQAA
ncbi:NUMOD3 domain-containing DNA-binding protein [Stutzerimonas stutzeri]|uniref:NUMOD3 domain-containing DNA-binding protein n=1 Tax=Stutzerimonas stutzeri TaxID=316 RepID=UPI000291A091|nr:NUMOD3 domain-containing DNA-binding protein [Stutzerimonas stutzeri]